MVEQVRRFNRTVTAAGRRARRPLPRPRPAARRGAACCGRSGADGCEVRALRARLGLDSGYLSRLLRVARGRRAGRASAPASADRRVRVARLTAAGARRASRARPRAATSWRASLLAPLTARAARAAGRRDGRGRAAADRGAWSRSSTVDPEHPDARHCLARVLRRARPPLRRAASTRRRQHRRAATSCGRRPACSSSPTCTASRSAAARSSTTATSRPRSSACGSPSRRAGSGSAAGCSPSSRRGPRAHGARRVRLETNRPLAEAIALYRSAGYARGAGVQRRAVRRPLVREGAVVRAIP